HVLVAASVRPWPRRWLGGRRRRHGHARIRGIETRLLYGPSIALALVRLLLLRRLATRRIDVGLRRVHRRRRVRGRGVGGGRGGRRRRVRGRRGRGRGGRVRRHGGGGWGVRGAEAVWSAGASSRHLGPHSR